MDTTNTRPDDRRYMSHEERAVEDPRYRGTVTRDVPAVTTCYCGKTVTHDHGQRVTMNGQPVECPRDCEANRP